MIPWLVLSDLSKVSDARGLQGTSGVHPRVSSMDTDHEAIYIFGPLTLSFNPFGVQRPHSSSRWELSRLGILV